MALPPLDGAGQETMADLSPAVAATPAGGAGTVGGACAPALNTTVAISQVVLAPVPAVAAGCAPAATTWSSARISMSLALEMVVRAVYPAPAVRVSPNPESE